MGSLRAKSSLKRSAITTSLSPETSYPVDTAVASSDLIALDGTAFEMPEFERSVNLACTANLDVDRARIFQQCILMREHNYNSHSLFHLPVALRLHIYDYCFPIELRKLTLSPLFATKAAFPPSSFASPFDVRADVVGGLQSFRILRHELSVYFWTQYHFHVTLSPFTARSYFSPLSTVWLKDYLPVIQFLTLEIDLTKFGLGVFIGASEFGTNLEVMETMVEEIMTGLSQRKGATTMMELNLLCRRYAGGRLSEASTNNGEITETSSDRTPYCPELSTLVCDSVLLMGGIIQYCRISGFTQNYTERLLNSVFGQSPHPHKLFVENDPAWPPLLQPGISTPHSTIHRSLLLTPSRNKYTYKLKTPRALFASNLKRAFSTTTPPSPTTRRLKTVTTSQPQTPTQRPSPKNSSLASIKLPILSTLILSADQTSPRSIPYSSTHSGSPTSPLTPSTPYLPLFGPHTSITAICPEYRLKLTRSRSFQDEFQDEISQSNLSSPSQNTAPNNQTRILQRKNNRRNIEVGVPDGVIQNAAVNEWTPQKNRQQHQEFQTPVDAVPDTMRSIDLSPKGNYAQHGSVVQGSARTVERQNTSGKVDGLVTSNTGLDGFDMRSKDTVNKQLVAATVLGESDTAQPWKLSSPARHSKIPVSRKLTPTRPRARPPLDTRQNSPNTMNNINERDPAFLRTMNAMRSFSEPAKTLGSNIRPISLQNVPKVLAAQSPEAPRPLTSLNNRTAGKKAKYFTLVSKIRGRFE